MSVEQFGKLLPSARFGKNDKKWFPRWLKRYAETVPSINGCLPVTRELVIAFSRSLLRNKTPAWQRLQAVRAVEAYRDLVLKRKQPSLADVRLKLSRAAALERDSSSPRGEAPGDTPLTADSVGILIPSESSVMRDLRRELRLQRKSFCTEKAYVARLFAASSRGRSATARAGFRTRPGRRFDAVRSGEKVSS